MPGPRLPSPPGRHLMLGKLCVVFLAHLMRLSDKTVALWTTWYNYDSTRLLVAPLFLLFDYVRSTSPIDIDDYGLGDTVNDKVDN